MASDVRFALAAISQAVKNRRSQQAVARAGSPLIAGAMELNRARSRSPRGMQILTFHLTITMWVRRDVLLPEALLDAIWNMVARLWHVAPLLNRLRRELKSGSTEVGAEGDLEREIHVALIFHELGELN